jgi:hypothetical protein
MDRVLFAALCRPRGDGLPYPDPPVALKRIVVHALREAWHRLCFNLASEGTSVTALDEDQTTTLLEDRLRALLDDATIGGFVVPFFAIDRDAKVVNFNGEHPDKMPDLSIRLCEVTPGRPADYALHVECKPVGRAHGMEPYLGPDGMGCFIKGDYACKMTSGIMVAYADHGYTFDRKIVPRLQKHYGSPDDPCATVQLPVAVSAYLGPATEPVSESVHRRGWTYANGQKPGDIRLIHVWLRRV